MAALAKAVELYGTASCPYTTELREHLQWRKVVFTEFDVETDRTAFDRLVMLTQGRTAVPVLVEDGRVSEIGWRGRSCMVA
jgi:glutaredoxin 3